MEKIVLDPDFHIHNDGVSWNLHMERTNSEISPKSGLPTVSKSLTYHSTLEMALREYVNKATKVSNSVAELIAKLDEVHETIKNLEKAI